MHPPWSILIYIDAFLARSRSNAIQFIRNCEILTALVSFKMLEDSVKHFALLWWSARQGIQKTNMDSSREISNRFYNRTRSDAEAPRETQNWFRVREQLGLFCCTDFVLTWNRLNDFFMNAQIKTRALWRISMKRHFFFAHIYSNLVASIRFVLLKMLWIGILFENVSLRQAQNKNLLWDSEQKGAFCHTNRTQTENGRQICWKPNNFFMNAQIKTRAPWSIAIKR